MSKRADYRGPALFSYGFRPFFLLACLFGLVSIPLWFAMWRGDVVLNTVFAPVDWHIHEMIFGYGSAVVAGFLFTAVPNWTGRMPARGRPLAVLAGLWVTGRLAVAGVLSPAPWVVVTLDQLFLLAVAGMIAREIVAGRNWRNLKVLAPVTLLWLANLLFHVEAMTQGLSDIGRRAGIALLIFLIMLIGGRIVPSFTRNWLAKRGAERLPTPFNRFDGASLTISAAALAIWTVQETGSATALILGFAALAQSARLSRWRGLATWPSALLFMLHAAYAFVPLGLLAAAFSAHGIAGPALGPHVLGIGAIGGMTVAVMMRATMGHTGRPLEAGPFLTLAFVLVLAATISRALASIPQFVVAGVAGATVLWAVAFALLVIVAGPWLVFPNEQRRQPNTPPHPPCAQ